MLSGPRPSDKAKQRLPRHHWSAAVRPNRTEIILAAALVLVGAAQVIIYLRQADIMEKQTRIAKDQLSITKSIEKAAVYQDGFDVWFQDDKLYIVFKWRNGGDSRAHNFAIATDCKQSKEKIADPFISFDGSTFVPQPDLPGKGQSIAGRCHITSTTPRISNGDKNASKFYFTGEARYKDIFDHNTLHITQFARELVEYDINFSKQEHGVLASEARGPHNCADDDCPR